MVYLKWGDDKRDGVKRLINGGDTGVGKGNYCRSYSSVMR